MTSTIVTTDTTNMIQVTARANLDEVIVVARILAGRVYWQCPPARDLRRLASDCARRAGRELAKGVGRSEIGSTSITWVFRYQLKEE